MLVIDRDRWGQKSFKDVQTFQNWLESERDFYQPLIAWMPNCGPQFQYFQPALNLLAQTAGAVEPDLTTRLDQAKAYASMVYKGWALPPSDTPDGKFIKSFAHNRELQARIAHQLAAPSPAVNDDQQAGLIVAAYRYPLLAGEKGFTFAQCSAEILRNLDADTGRARDLIEQVRQGKDAVLESIVQTGLRALHEEKLAGDQQRSDLNSEWTSLKEKFASQNAMMAPRDYWSEQRSAHELGARTARRWLIGGGLIVAVVVAGLITRLWFVTGAMTPADIPLAMWVVTGAILGLGFWIVKQLARIFFSREHLTRDAEERVTMIQTYLALLEGGHVAKEDLKFVLASIFRPTEDGLVRDDGLPAPLVELFQANKKP